ncbi:MAG: MarR family transcriptional regulator [Lachnospiraceae bacterium]|nr:MarR family transcriptional regulator [Lachnospiraceae bacterium]
MDGMERRVESFLNGVRFRKLFDQEYGPIRKKYNLCRIDLQILTYLESAGEYNTSKNIVDTGFFTKGHVSQSLTRLQQKELVELQQDKQDRRLYHLFLTEKAKEIVSEVHSIQCNINKIVFQGISEEELHILSKIAAKITDNIQKETGI